MPSRKRKQDELHAGDEALLTQDGFEPNFQIVINPAKSNASTYYSDFGSRLNLNYAVQLRGSNDVWSKIKNYRSFQAMNSDTVIPVNSFVYVKGSTALPKSKRSKNDNRAAAPEDEVEYESWVAQVLECRAADRKHVFLRVVWLYWPDDLHAYGGRRDYHGDSEVIPSNDMQIINAMTVDGLAELERWDDKKHANYMSQGDCLIWRQTLNVHAKGTKLSLAPDPVAHCICNQPANPSLFLFQCRTCMRWMHEECITDNAIREATNNDLRQLPSPKLAKSDQDDGETKVNGSTVDSNSTGKPTGLLARVYGKFIPKHKTPKAMSAASTVSAAQGKLPKISQRSGKQNIIDDEASPDQKLGYAVADVPPSPLPQRRKKATNKGGGNLEATVKEASPDHPDRPPTILLTRKDKSKARTVWEQPMYCLFKDCGKLIL